MYIVLRKLYNMAYSLYLNWLKWR